MFQNSFDEDLLDLRDLLKQEEDILDEDNTPDDEDWAFLRNMRELRGQFYDIEEQARNEPTLVNEDYKGEYAENYASESVGVDTSDWPLNCIDWEAAADALFRYDWTEYAVGEHTYLGRNF